jgi:protoheme IX farnesyltransferase
LFGIALSIAGLIVLTLGGGLLSGTLAVVILGSYLFVYTPLKQRTALCTLVGAIPGAIPPLIGWAAARGDLGAQAWLLFCILFLWQLPHFLAIAWIYRDDYARAGFQMLPVLDPEGGFTSRQIALYCLALVPVSLLPTIFGLSGAVYFLAALVSSLAFLGYGCAIVWNRSSGAAHRLFLASVIYLPWILFTMTLDRVI